MHLLNKIRPLWFFLAFGVGLCVCYMFTPPPTVVVKFPSPRTADKVVYHNDVDDSCYSFKAQQVACTSQSKEQPLPMQ